MGSSEVGLGRMLAHGRVLGGRATQGRLYAPYVQYVREVDEIENFFSLTKPSTFVPSPTTNASPLFAYSPPKNLINAEVLPTGPVPGPCTADGATMYECTSPARDA